MVKAEYFRRLQTQQKIITGTHERNLLSPSSMNKYSKSRNLDLCWRGLRHRLREDDIQATIVHSRLDVLVLQALWQRERPREFTVAALTERISLLLALGGLLRLTSYGEDVVVDVD